MSIENNAVLKYRINRCREELMNLHTRFPQINESEVGKYILDAANFLVLAESKIVGTERTTEEHQKLMRELEK